MNGRETRARRASSPAARTYPCLAGLRTKPSDYEVTTTALLYYPDRGFEVKTPVWQHYVEHQRQGQLCSEQWDSFRDPAHTTYSSYVAERRDQEVFLDRAFALAPSPLAPELEPLLGFISALRFPLHGLQMTAAYVGALAPSGRISVAAAFQAADELRRVQRLCQWLSRSGRPLDALDALGRELWQAAPELQPLRRGVERLLVTYDWGVALIALNGVLKPLLEQLCFVRLAEVARRHREDVLAQTLTSLADDGRGHAAWFMALLRQLIAERPRNALVIAERLAEARPRFTEATCAVVELLGSVLGDAQERQRVTRELAAALEQHLAPLELGPDAGDEGRRRGVTA